VHNFIPRAFQLALLLGSAEATEAAAAKEGKACCWKTFFFHYSTVLYHSCIFSAILGSILVWLEILYSRECSRKKNDAAFCLLAKPTCVAFFSVS